MSEQTDVLENTATSDVVRGLSKNYLSEQLKQLLMILPLGMVVLDSRGKVQLCNKIAEDLLGIPLFGEDWLAIIHRSFAPRADDGHEISLRDGRRVSIMTCSLLEGPGQLVVLHDLTETRVQQEKVSQQQQLLAMGKMMASLAHQIRTPLTSAMLYATHLEDGGISEDKKIKCSHKLLNSLHNIEKQISDMLVFAKGNKNIVEKINLKEFLSKIPHSLESHLQSRNANIDIMVAQENIIFEANEVAIFGALQNLIINSLQACMQNPVITIYVTYDAEQLIFLVKDNGCGISPENQQKIFEAFYTTKQQGTGLGLAVVKTVAEAHQGKLWVSSVAGCGSEIGFSILRHGK